jgi:2,3-bisphosphoglycerate-independent phosphoglycerate mutase
MKPVVLVILDGWGLASAGPGNAVILSETPTMNKLWANYPHTQLLASGTAVGLPKYEAGNSETGHLNLGAGRVVYQDLPRISFSIADGSFFQNKAFLAAFAHVRQNNSKLHLMGLVGAGGVHSNLEHLFALLVLAKKENFSRVFLHIFTDGRDSPPTSAQTFITQIEMEIKKMSLGKIATVMGRYYALDRDFRWERTKMAYEALVLGKGEIVASAAEAVTHSYQEGKTDEFISPAIIVDQTGKSIGLIEDNDAVIFFNFRIDRPRQLTRAFVVAGFESYLPKRASFDPYAERYGKKQYEAVPEIATFKRGKILKNLFFVTMTEYEKGLPVSAVAFPPSIVNLPLARILAENNLTQLHLAETEKERFVTYYFDGERENPFPGEKWNEVPSPGVPTYDQKPEMSADKIYETFTRALKMNYYDFILINFANPDMVGHTGIIPAGIKACQTVDFYLGKMVEAVLAMGGLMIVTADHGNVEEMINLKTGKVDTEHSTNPVPFILVRQDFSLARVLSLGSLSDVAPTILEQMGINKPAEMTGRSLI